MFVWVQCWCIILFIDYVLKNDKNFIQQSVIERIIPKIHKAVGMTFVSPSYCQSRKSWILGVLYLLVSGADSEWERIKLTLALSLSTFAPLLDLNNLNALFQLGWTWNELLAWLEYFGFISHLNWSSNLRRERKHYMNVGSSNVERQFSRLPPEAPPW